MTCLLWVGSMHLSFIPGIATLYATSYYKELCYNCVSTHIQYTCCTSPLCTSPISHNAPFCYRNVHIRAHFCYKMVYCGIFVSCIVGCVREVYRLNISPMYMCNVLIDFFLTPLSLRKYISFYKTNWIFIYASEYWRILNTIHRELIPLHHSVRPLQ